MLHFLSPETVGTTMFTPPVDQTTPGVDTTTTQEGPLVGECDGSGSYPSFISRERQGSRPDPVATTQDYTTTYDPRTTTYDYSTTTYDPRTTTDYYQTTTDDYTTTTYDQTTATTTTTTTTTEGKQICWFSSTVILSEKSEFHFTVANVKMTHSINIFYPSKSVRHPWASQI